VGIGQQEKLQLTAEDELRASQRAHEYSQREESQAARLQKKKRHETKGEEMEKLKKGEFLTGLAFIKG